MILVVVEDALLVIAAIHDVKGKLVRRQTPRIAHLDTWRKAVGSWQEKKLSDARS
jgi:hypothetical protein